MNELFPIPESPLPPLEAARRKLALAIEAEKEAKRELDEADEDEISPREYRDLEETASITEYVSQHAEAELVRLEQIEIRTR